MNFLIVIALDFLSLTYAKIIAIVIFLFLLLITWLLPYDFILMGAPDRKRWRDLRLWATLLTALQIVIYYLF